LSLGCADSASHHPAFRLTHLPAVFPNRDAAGMLLTIAIIREWLSQSAPSVTQAGSNSSKAILIGVLDSAKDDRNLDRMNARPKEIASSRSLPSLTGIQPGCY
jgi:hypothetical protein